MPRWMRTAQYVLVVPGLALAAGPAVAQISSPPQALSRLATPPQAAGFGHAVAGLGDVDGDGAGDVVVTAPPVDRAWVISGAGGTILHEVGPTTPGFEFGAAVAAVGDLDRDGVSDFAVGAPSDRAVLPGAPGGRIFVFSGASGAMLRPLAPITEHPDFGRSVAGPGDVSGDGVPDVVTGGPGSASAFSGANGAQLWSRAEPVASFGQIVAATPDVTGDGVADVLASAPGGQAAPGAGQVVDLLAGVLHRVLSPAAPGRVHVLSGATGAVVRAISDPAPQENDAFGGSVAAVGDQDGDGVVDHLIGEGGAHLLHLYSGDDGALVRSFAAPTAVQGQVTLGLAHVADNDGDGRDDIWVGVGPARGAFLVNGMGTVLRSVGGPTPEGSFGASVGSLDIGGQGGGDVVLGDPTQPGGGAAYVLRSGPRASTAAGVVGETPLRTRAQTSDTTTTTTASTTASTTSSIPSTAVLPKPAAGTVDERPLASTGARDRSGPGLLALALGSAGIVVLRRTNRNDA